VGCGEDLVTEISTLHRTAKRPVAAKESKYQAPVVVCLTVIRLKARWATCGRLVNILATGRQEYLVSVCTVGRRLDASWPFSCKQYGEGGRETRFVNTEVLEGNPRIGASSTGVQISERTKYG